MNPFSNEAILIATEPCLKCVIFIHPRNLQSHGSGTISLILSITAPAMALEPNLSIENHGQIGRAMIQSLSFLNVGALASRLSPLNENVMQDLKEVSIFLESTEGPPRKRHRRALEIASDDEESDHSSEVNMEEDVIEEDIRHQLQIISQMNPKGLEQRLMDAFDSVTFSRGSKSSEVSDVSTNPLKYKPIMLYLKRAEAIVRELTSAMHQQETRRKRQRKTLAPVKDEGSMEGSQRSPRHFQALLEALPQVETLLDRDKGDLLDINDSLTQLTITYHDGAGRHHLLIGNLHVKSFPLVGPSWTCDLPCEFNPSWASASTLAHTIKQGAGSGGSSIVGSSGSGRLLHACVRQFIGCITKYQPLWNELDDLDAHAWVLEPSLPSLRSCAERRVALRPGLSIHFKLDPEDVRSIPLSLRLVGGGDGDGDGESAFDLRKRYREYISNEVGPSSDVKEKGTNMWSGNKSIRSNIEVCFGFPLPSPETTEKADFIAECGICYTHRLPLEEDDEKQSNSQGQQSRKEAFLVPNVLCGNSKCGRSYHETCLFEWLYSLPDSKISFDRIFGTCPYCMESISVKMKTSKPLFH